MNQQMNHNLLLNEECRRTIMPVTTGIIICQFQTRINLPGNLDLQTLLVVPDFGLKQPSRYRPGTHTHTGKRLEWMTQAYFILL